MQLISTSRNVKLVFCELKRDEIPLEIQYVGVLIKSFFSDCELLKLFYLKLAA